MIVFLAAPFTSKLQYDGSQSQLSTDFAQVIRDTIANLRSKDHKVFSSHEREKWGTEIYKPEAALREDFKCIELSDVVVAFLGDPISPGVQMELGFSIAHNKSIVIFYTQDFNDLPHLTKGMNALPKVSFVHLKSFANLSDLTLERVRLDHIKATRAKLR